MNYDENNSMSNSLKQGEVLLIEDDPDHAELIIDILKMEGLEKDIILLNDGQEAIDYFQEKNIGDNGVKLHQIDLVILDLNLPKVHGIKVLKFIKNNPKYCSVPVIILSTSSDQVTINKAFKNGANGYITKPISYDEFVEKVKILKEYC
ncbi:MAG: response regulator [Candidatus Scalinduaceae bacterium]